MSKARWNLASFVRRLPLFRNNGSPSSYADEAAQQELVAINPSYQPLPRKTCTRLFILNPGGDDAPIECSLKVVDMDANPQFIAISHTLGDPGDELEILVDGSTVSIRRNLRDCLHTMRDPIAKLHFWIDALSISQSNLDEKSHQVAMIGRIFSQAFEVRAWLGPHADDSHLIFRDEDIMKRLRRNWLVTIIIWIRRILQLGPALYLLGNFVACIIIWRPSFSKTRATVNSRWPFNVIALIALIAVSLAAYFYLGRQLQQVIFESTRKVAVYEYSTHLRPLTALLSRPYWNRTWIVQEITQAKSLTIWCGSDSMAWTQFVRIFLGINLDAGWNNIMLLSEASSHPDTILTANSFEGDPQSSRVGIHISRVISLALACRRKHTILEFTTSFRHTKCAIEQDRVYALLSLDVGGQGGPEILPNYRLSMTEVATEVLRARLPQNRDNAESAVSFMATLGLPHGEALRIMQKLGYSRHHYVLTWYLLFFREYFRAIGLKHLSRWLKIED